VTEPTKKLAKEKLAAAGITVSKEGSLSAEVIEKNKLIDNHYYAIANKARPRHRGIAPRAARSPPRRRTFARPSHRSPPTPRQYASRRRRCARLRQASLTKPADLNPPEKGQAEFEKKFGLGWKKALADGVVYNAVDGCKRLGIGGAEMDKQWAAYAATRMPPRPNTSKPATNPRAPDARRGVAGPKRGTQAVAGVA
jgi:hypothetical protein